jgi:hypothetical protein
MRLAKKTTLLLSGFAVAAAAMVMGTAMAVAQTGVARDWQLGFQEAATPTMVWIEEFHTLILWIITAIVLFVLALLIIVMVRFNAKSNPVPSKTTHNTFVEVAWTLIPILILLVIAVPSFRLLYFDRTIPDADLTIKAIGPTGWRRWVYSTNHKDIGTMYLVFAIISGIIGGDVGADAHGAACRRACRSSATHMFNVFTTAHGLIMIFFMVMPAMIGGFGNWFVPIMIGAPDMAFPRMNNISFWLLPPALRSCCSSRCSCRARPAPPASAAAGRSIRRCRPPGQPGPAMDFAILSLHIAGASSILARSTSSPPSSTCARRA